MSENNKNKKGIGFKAGVTLAAITLLLLSSAAQAKSNIPVHDLPQLPDNEDMVTVQAKGAYYIGNKIGTGDSYIGVHPDGALIEFAMPSGDNPEIFEEGRLYIDPDGNVYEIEIGEDGGGNHSEAKVYRVPKDAPVFTADLKKLTAEVNEEFKPELTVNDWAHNLSMGQQSGFSSGIKSVRDNIISKAKKNFFARFNFVQLADNQQTH